MNNPTLKAALSAVNAMQPSLPDPAQPLTETEIDDDDLEEISGGLSEDASCPSYEPD